MAMVSECGLCPMSMPVFVHAELMVSLRCSDMVSGVGSCPRGLTVSLVHPHFIPHLSLAFLLV